MLAPPPYRGPPQSVGVAVLVAGFLLWRRRSGRQARHLQHRASRTTATGASVVANLDAATKAWLLKSTEQHQFPDLSRTARMAIDYVAQETVPAEVFTADRVASKAARHEGGDLEIVLDRAQVDWLDQMVQAQVRAGWRRRMLPGWSVTGPRPLTRRGGIGLGAKWMPPGPHGPEPRHCRCAGLCAERGRLAHLPH